MHELEDKMKRTLDAAKQKMGTIRTGRANPDVLSRIQVDYYGTAVPIQQVANISVSENSTLVLNVYDRNAVQSVEKAIMKSDLGITPNTDGAIIRLKMPELTSERRKELVKIVKAQSEEGKIALRNIRRDFLEGQKKAEDLSEDERKRNQETAQKIIDKYVAAMDELAKNKEAEILKV